MSSPDRIDAGRSGTFRYGTRLLPAAPVQFDSALVHAGAKFVAGDSVRRAFRAQTPAPDPEKRVARAVSDECASDSDRCVSDTPICGAAVRISRAAIDFVRAAMHIVVSAIDTSASAMRTFRSGFPAF